MQTATLATIASQPTRMPLDIAALHSTHHRRLIGGLARKGVSTQNLEDAYQDLMLASLEHAAAFNSNRSTASTFVGNMQLRIVARQHRTCQISAQHRVVSAESLRRYYPDGPRTAVTECDPFSALGIGAYDADEAFGVALAGFLRAVQRSLTPTETRVFAAAGGLASVSIGIGERGPIAETLEMSDCALRKQLHNVTNKIRAIWPDHFDAALPE